MALKKANPQQIACPYCFVKLNLSQIAYRCSGIPAPGRPACVPYRDFVRADVLGDASPVLPPVLARNAQGQHIVSKDDLTNPELVLTKIGKSVKCDRCQGATSLCICPHCHSILPDETAQGAISIGVVGARLSGKTVWLAMLEQQLISVAPERFQSSIDHPGGTVGLANNLVTFRQSMEDSSKLPDQTASIGAGRQMPAVYNWKFSNGVARVISIYDTAGEDVARRDFTMMQGHLSASNAIVLVIDPFTFAANRNVALQRGIRDERPETLNLDVLDGLVSVLRQAESARSGRSSGKITTPVAVAVTKMDAFWNELSPQSALKRIGQQHGAFDVEESRQVHTELVDLIRSWGGAAVLNKLEAEFANYRLFSVSALGNEPDYAHNALSDALSPARVLDPVLWILSEQNFVGKLNEPGEK